MFKLFNFVVCSRAHCYRFHFHWQCFVFRILGQFFPQPYQTQQCRGLQRRTRWRNCCYDGHWAYPFQFSRTRKLGCQSYMGNCTFFLIIDCADYLLYNIESEILFFDNNNKARSSSLSIFMLDELNVICEHDVGSLFFEWC